MSDFVLNLPFDVEKTTPITIKQNGPFIFTLNQITQTRKLKTQNSHSTGFTSLNLKPGCFHTRSVMRVFRLHTFKVHVNLMCNPCDV